MNNAEFPGKDDSSVKARLLGVDKLNMFPICVLNISDTRGSAELLLCYNECGIFVDETGRRTRAVDPTWSHFPFTFGKYYFNYTLIILHY